MLLIPILLGIPAPIKHDVPYGWPLVTTTIKHYISELISIHMYMYFHRLVCMYPYACFMYVFNICKLF